MKLNDEKVNAEQRQMELRKYYFKPEPFWENLSPMVWEELKSASFPKKHPKKSIIYEEGKYPSGLYIIRKGMVKVFVINHDGSEQIIYFMGKDEMFGLRSIVSEDTSPVFIETLEDCTVDCIPKAELIRALYGSTELMAAILRYLGNEFRVFVNKISFFTNRPVSERVALAILVLNEKFNPHQPLVKAISFSRKDLANYIGIATENLIRQLSNLKNSGAIVVKGRKIILHNFELLFEQAKLS